MRVGSLFSGVGGIDLGLERAGMHIAWQAESDSYCRAVLRNRWPDVPCYGDVRSVHVDAPPVDLICGGFPCQPVSVAGKGLAQADDRWLWPEFARVVRLLRPRYVLVENVPGLLARGMGDVLGDLAGLGFDAEWESIPASALGAPHRRDRVWIVAYASSTELRHEPGRRHGSGRSDSSLARDDGAEGAVADAPRVRGRQSRKRAVDGGASRGGVERQRAHAPAAGLADPEVFTERPGLCTCGQTGQRRGRSRDRGCAGHAWDVEPDVGRVADGVPSRVDRLRALGNAVVPQVAEWIGRQIMTHAFRPADSNERGADA